MKKTLDELKDSLTELASQNQTVGQCQTEVAMREADVQSAQAILVMSETNLETEETKEATMYDAFVQDLQDTFQEPTD